VLVYGHWALSYYRRRIEGAPKDTSSLDPSQLHARHKLTRLALLLPLMYVGFATLSYVVAPSPVRVSYELCMAVQVFLAAVYIITHIRTSKDLVFVCAWLVIGVCISGLISAGLRVLGQGFNFGVLKGRVDEGWEGLRVGGTVGTPNTTAGYFCWATIFACGLLLAKIPRWLKVTSAFGAIFGSIGLIATLSRGGWIAAGIAIVVLVALGLYRRLINPLAALVITLTLAGVMVAFQGVIVERLTTADDHGSAESRIPLDEMAWTMIKDHPVLGVGLNNFELAMQDYLTPDMTGEWVYIVHNRYLLLWSETGVGGLVGYVGFILLGMVCGWQAIKARDPLLSPIALGAFAGCCGLLFHFAGDIFSGRNATELAWLAAGLQLTLWRLSTQPQESHDLQTSDSRGTRDMAQSARTERAYG